MDRSCESCVTQSAFAQTCCVLSRKRRAGREDSSRALGTFRAARRHCCGLGYQPRRHPPSCCRLSSSSCPGSRVSWCWRTYGELRLGRFPRRLLVPRLPRRNRRLHQRWMHPLQLRRLRPERSRHPLDVSLAEVTRSIAASRRVCPPAQHNQPSRRLRGALGWKESGGLGAHQVGERCLRRASHPGSRTGEPASLTTSSTQRVSTTPLSSPEPPLPLRLTILNVAGVAPSAEAGVTEMAARPG